MDKLTSFMSKHVPVYVVVAMLIIAAMGPMIVYAALSVQTTNVTTLGGEVFKISEDLTLAPQGIGISTADVEALGTSGTPVVMVSAPGASANTAITQGHFEYKLSVTIAYPEAGTAYTVNLLADGASKGTVYIKQATTGSGVDEFVTIRFDLGASLSTAVYEIQVAPVL